MKAPTKVILGVVALMVFALVLVLALVLGSINREIADHNEAELLVPAVWSLAV